MRGCKQATGSTKNKRSLDATTPFPWIQQTKLRRKNTGFLICPRPQNQLSCHGTEDKVPPLRSMNFTHLSTYKYFAISIKIIIHFLLWMLGENRPSKWDLFCYWMPLTNKCIFILEENSWIIGKVPENSEFEVQVMKQIPWYFNSHACINTYCADLTSPCTPQPTMHSVTGYTPCSHCNKPCSHCNKPSIQLYQQIS